MIILDKTQGNHQIIYIPNSYSDKADINDTELSLQNQETLKKYSPQHLTEKEQNNPYFYVVDFDIYDYKPGEYEYILEIFTRPMKTLTGIIKIV